MKMMDHRHHSNNYIQERPHKTWLTHNMTRKKIMANLIRKKIKTLLTKQKKVSIILQLKEKHKYITKEKDIVNIIVIAHPIQIKMKVEHQDDKRASC